ncbi:MAG: hypothetical protein HYX29_01895 [Solirubrobacterales bacterium]|nr:hypothetical protein [Solirubrobacterales bacterium]
MKLKPIRKYLIAALTVASVFAFSTSAQAGTYVVNQPGCGIFASGGALDGWGGGIYCGAFGATWLQLNSTLNNPVGPPGSAIYVKSQRVNNGAAMTALTLTYASSETGTADPNVILRGCLRYQGTTDVWAGGYAGSCVGAALPTPDQANFAARSWTSDLLTCNSCGGFQWGATSGPGNGVGPDSGFMAVSNAQATITDTIVPTVSTTLANYAISQGNWLRGTVGVGASAADTGGGISSMAFVPLSDITQTVTTSPACNYANLNPCATSRNWTGTFDTTNVDDGTQSGRYTATDPGSNTAPTANFTFKVDNTKPTTPNTINPVTNGDDGWSSNNSFGATWTNGSEVSETATQSGLSSVIVDVYPNEPGHTNPAPVTVPIGGTASGISATNSSISGVTVPETGRWAMRLQLVDRAGNVSDVGDGTGGSADSDVSIGYDPNPPAAPQGQANGWISRDELAAGFNQEFSYTASPSSLAPVCGFAGAIDKSLNGTAGTSINVPGGGSVRSWQLPGTLDEDTHYVHLRAVSCAGIASPTTETVTAPVDRTDPVGTITGVENGKWYKNGQIAELRATDALSGMAPAPTNEVLSTKGAYLAYSINGTGPLDVDAPRGDTTSIPITGEGQKELRFSPVDLAGNKAAAKVATFGIDATNPNGYIDRPDSARPTLLSAKLTDAPSGVSYAIFSVRPVGGSDADWIQLPTSLAGADGNVVGSAVSNGIATARFPDTTLGQGTYDVRVQAFDQAGNPLATQRYQDGSLARVENPMRAASGVSVKLFKALRECDKGKDGKMKCAIKKCPTKKNAAKSKGICYKVLKGKVVLQGGSTTVTSAYNRGAIATGVLTDANGSALKNTDVVVTTTAKASGKNAEVGVATTDANGIWAIRVPAGVNRAVKATYEGTETRRPSTSTGTLNTQAKLKLKVSKKRAKTGQTITFSGKVTPYDATYPSGGKIVALQFFAAKKWRPAVGVGHTDQKGNFKLKYKFDGRKVRAKIIFRVVAPSEDAWGHAFSASKPVSIKLNY